MKRNKAYRIHHKKRMRKHAFNLIKAMYMISDEDAIEKSKRLGDNIAKCSCQMCRNPRHCDWSSKKEKLTIQERKNLIE